jgi:hypothetical protein
MDNGISYKEMKKNKKLGDWLENDEDETDRKTE